MDQPRPLFLFIFVIFKHFTEKIVGILQRDLNLDCWNNRRAGWPLNNQRHGPSRHWRPLNFLFFAISNHDDDVTKWIKIKMDKKLTSAWANKYVRTMLRFTPIEPMKKVFATSKIYGKKCFKNWNWQHGPVQQNEKSVTIKLQIYEIRFWVFD